MKHHPARILPRPRPSLILFIETFFYELIFIYSIAQYHLRLKPQTQHIVASDTTLFLNFIILFYVFEGFRLVSILLRKCPSEKRKIKHISFFFHIYIDTTRFSVLCL